MKIQSNALKGLQQIAYVPHLNPLLNSTKDGLFKYQGNFSALPSYKE